MTCEHQYQFQGAVYSYGRQLAGSSAVERVYEDRYYCVKCLHVADRNLRVEGTSYTKPIEGAMPK